MSAAVHCPECQSTELVRALASPIVTYLRPRARCLVCGRRFRVSRTDYRSLRRPVLGEPNESWSDRLHYMDSAKMTKGQSVVTVIAAVIGFILASWFDMVPLVLVAIYAGWWLGRILAPPVETIPGKCPKCRYDRRGSVGTKCPECGGEW